MSKFMESKDEQDGLSKKNKAAQPRPGLRERKKKKTKSLIQRHAMRLFHEQGYRETTIEQIAEAAEVSPSTFFRYFPTKEAVVLEDDYDPLLIRAFEEQPAALSPFGAFRKAVLQIISEIPPEEMAFFKERMELAEQVPELRAATLNHMNETLEMMAGIIARRAGRPPTDISVLAFTGALFGTMMSASACFSKDPSADFADLLDKALGSMASGFPLFMDKPRDGQPDD